MHTSNDIGPHNRIRVTYCMYIKLIKLYKIAKHLSQRDANQHTAKNP